MSDSESGNRRREFPVEEGSKSSNVGKPWVSKVFRARLYIFTKAIFNIFIPVSNFTVLFPFFDIKYVFDPCSLHKLYIKLQIRGL